MHVPGAAVAFRRRLLAGLLCCCSLLALPAGCSVEDDQEPGRCGVDGTCPPGQVCDRSTDRCREGPEPPANPEPVRYLSIAVAPDGKVWLAGQVERTPPALGVAWLEQGSDLTVELLAEGKGMAEGTSIALSPSGTGEAQPCVAFHDAGRGRLLYAQRQGSTWVIEEAAAGATGGARGVGSYPSMALDAAGQPWIAFHDAVRGALAVTHRSGGRWLTEMADEPAPGEGPRGLYASLVLVQGQPLVAHHDAGGGDLRLSLREEHGWRSTILAGHDPQLGDTGDMGRFASATVDPFGNAAVAFYDATRGTLLLARNDRGVLRVEEVDGGEGAAVPGSPRPAPKVGQFASLVHGRGGQQRIAYLDAAALDLRLATRDGAGWSIRTLAEDGVAGLWAAQAVDGEGNSVVAHCRLQADPAASGRLQHRLEVLWP